MPAALTGGTSRHPIRVLHVVGALVYGGIETWLMHLFRSADPTRVKHEILLMKAERGPYEPEAEALGVVLHRARRGGRVESLRRLDALLATQSYDVVHSHAYLFSGLLLAVAARHGVPVRIAHSHHAELGDTGGTLLERFKHRLLTSAIARFATVKIGVSESAIEEIAGQGWASDPSSRILGCGFDFSGYPGVRQRAAALRRQLGIEQDAPVLGHVGRFVPVKNHRLLIRAFAELRNRLPEARLVLVGDGPGKAECEAEARKLGIGGSVTFVGASGDVPSYMGMFDLLMLPSFSEGLPTVVLEAQAAGTPSLISSVVTNKVEVVPGLVTWLDVSLPPERWADCVAELISRPAADSSGSWRRLNESPYGIGHCMAQLEAIYELANG
jgi:glycosyltransferase involved in cell wall biosynthesis